MKKEEMVIEFADGTKGMLSMDTIKGRDDVKAEYADVRVYYYTEHVNNQWIVKRCNEGFCYDSVIIAEKATRKEAIEEIILDVRKNQVRTANTYILETSTGRMFELVATSEHLAKKCVSFKCGLAVENLSTKEIKKADETKQQKARLGEYADFINELLPTPSDEPKTEEEEEAANEHFVKQMSECEHEYMGVEYTDALHMDNWKKYLLDTMYEGDNRHSEIYIVVSDEYEVIGWYWFKQGAEQFHRLHGGKIIKVTSALFYLQNICNLYKEIIRSFDIDGISIKSQLINNGYRVSYKNTSYIFECLQEYCYLYETDGLLRKHFGISFSVTLSTYLKLTQNDLDSNKEIEKTLLAFCMNMLYLLDHAIFMFLSSVVEKGGENNDNC